ncbi:hypothetical protein KCTC52924_02566 [Arenibacter antarcticus]
MLKTLIIHKDKWSILYTILKVSLLGQEGHLTIVHQNINSIKML